MGKEQKKNGNEMNEKGGNGIEIDEEEIVCLINEKENDKEQKQMEKMKVK